MVKRIFMSLSILSINSRKINSYLVNYIFRILFLINRNIFLILEEYNCSTLLLRSEVRMSELVGNGSIVFLQTEEDENSELALSVLTQAMQEMGVVAIVRYTIHTKIQT